MRYKRVELSAQDKPQYVIALGVRDIELLLAEAQNAYRYTPKNALAKQDRERLGGIVKGLSEALVAANELSDDGEKVYAEDKHKFRSEYLDKITRFEIIDYRPCSNCNGTRRVLTETDTAAGQSTAFSKECPKCNGMGSKGREVVFWDKDTKITSSVQDEGRTLKVFIDKREK